MIGGPPTGQVENANRPVEIIRRQLVPVTGSVALLGLSAVGLEFTANLVGEGSKEQQILGFFEEYGEMVASSLLLWSAVVVTVARASG